MSGEKTAVHLALEARAAEEAEEFTAEQQFDMLGLGNPKAGTRPQRIAEAAKRGRPPGARNKRTLEMVAYLSSRYRSPLETLAVISTMGIDELASRLRCKPVEALQEIRNAATALLPYWHQKMPLAVDVTNRRVVMLQIGEDGEPAANEDAEELIPLAGGEEDGK